jgi:hypothetical protein
MTMQDVQTQLSVQDTDLLRAHIEDLLDQALEDSFPASDPVAAACFE